MKKITISVAIFMASLFLNIIAAQEFQWVKKLAGVTPNDVFADFSGTYITGSFENTVDFDPGSGIVSKTSNGGKDIFLAKFNGDSLEWVITMGSSLNDEAMAIHYDNYQSYLYITGSFQETVDFAPPNNQLLTSGGGKDLFYAYYSTFGQYMGAGSFSGSGNSVGTSITTLDMGEFFVGGYFDGELMFDSLGYQVFKNGGTGSMLIAGGFSTPSWVMTGNGLTGQSETTDLFIDYWNRELYFTGSFSNTLEVSKDYTTQSSFSNGGEDIFFGKYDVMSGNWWLTSAGGPDNDVAKEIAVSEMPTLIHIAGNFEGQTNLDPNSGAQNLSSKGFNDIFLAQYDTSGKFRWANQYGSPGVDTSIGLGVDYDGNITLGGNSDASFNIDIAGYNYPYTIKGAMGSWFIQTNITGDNKMLLPMIGDNDVVATSFGMNHEMLVPVGSFSNNFDFDLGNGNATLTSSGKDMFVASYWKYMMYLDLWQTYCPMEPFYMNPGRNDSPGLELIWQVDEGSGWQTIMDNFHYKKFDNDSLEVIPDISFQDNKYRCIAKDNFGIDTAEAWDSLKLYPLTPVSIGEDTTVIPGVKVSLDAGFGFSSYQWNTGESTQSIVTDSAGYYIVTISDMNGCHNSDTVALNVTFLVTIDTATNQIMAVWGKSMNANESIKIYKSVAGNDTLLSTVNQTAENRFYDSAADPAKGPITYIFEYSNSSTGETKILARHVTMYLDAIAYPDENKTILSWNPYEGLSYDTFYVYRGLDAKNMELIGKVKYNRDNKPYSFKDVFIDDTVYYRVEVETKVSVLVNAKKSNSGPFSRSLSNLEDNRQQVFTGIVQKPVESRDSDNPLRIYPNPVNGSCTVEFPNKNNYTYTLSVIDLSGKMVRQMNDISSGSIEFYPGNIRPGIYIVELRGEDVYRQRIVIQ